MALVLNRCSCSHTHLDPRRSQSKGVRLMIHDLVEGKVIRTINLERVLYVEWEHGSTAVAVCMGDVTLTHQAKDAKEAEDSFDAIREKLLLLARSVDKKGGINYSVPKPVVGN